MEYFKKFYGRATLNDLDVEELDEALDIELEYYETKNSLTFLKNAKPYGIEIIKKHMRGQEEKIEAKVLNNICEKENQVSEILNFLMRYKVTPINAAEVLEDKFKKAIVE